MTKLSREPSLPSGMIYEFLGGLRCNSLAYQRPNLRPIWKGHNSYQNSVCAQIRVGRGGSVKCCLFVQPDQRVVHSAAADVVDSSQHGGTSRARIVIAFVSLAYRSIYGRNPSGLPQP